MTTPKPPRPLSPHALDKLRQVASGPMPSLDFNPGVRQRFARDGLTVVVSLPSPYKTHRGGECDHEQITDAGLALVRAAGQKGK